MFWDRASFLSICHLRLCVYFSRLLTKSIRSLLHKADCSYEVLTMHNALFALSYMMSFHHFRPGWRLGWLTVSTPWNHFLNFSLCYIPIHIHSNARDCFYLFAILYICCGANSVSENIKKSQVTYSAPTQRQRVAFSRGLITYFNRNNHFMLGFCLDFFKWFEHQKTWTIFK